MAGTSPTPPLAWRAFALGGIGTMTALTVSDAAWAAWRARLGPRPPRKVIAGVLAGTAAVHVIEAAVVGRRARAAGLDHPGRWARTALLYGFPVFGRLAEATAPAAVPVDVAG